MEIKLLTIGRTRTDFVKAGIEAYLKRLRHYVPFSIDELPDVRTTKSTDKNSQKEMEGKQILSLVTSSDQLILLDERGREYSSLEFAAFLEKTMAMGRKRIIFAVGGPYGFSQDVYNRADAKVSLSRMTFNHEMVRMFFVEQVYRAMTILRGEPYHHE